MPFREPSGLACNSYELWREDVDLVAGLGLDTYRFSVEWARVEPDEGHFSDEALEHYQAITGYCLARGIAPACDISLVKLADAVANLAAVAIGVAGMAAGRTDLLRRLTVVRLHEQYRARVYPQLIPMIEAAREAGALGACLSGAGSAILAFASLDMLLADKGRVDTLAGGVPEWWFEVIMPVGFAVMSVRAAKMAPFRKAKIFCFALIAAVLPFVISRIFFGRGAGLVMPDGPTLLRGHTGALGWPGSLLLFVSFLLGAPVFVVMAGFALLLFFLAGTPIASVPAETFRLVVSPTLPAIPLLTVAGYVLAEGGASKRLVRAAQSVFGWMPGGLAVVAAFVCALFAARTHACPAVRYRFLAVAFAVAAAFMLLTSCQSGGAPARWTWRSSGWSAPGPR